MLLLVVFENLEAGATIDEIVEQFDITREQINAVIAFASRSLDAPIPALPAWTRRSADSDWKSPSVSPSTARRAA